MRYIVLGVGTAAAALLGFIAIAGIFWFASQVGVWVPIAVAVAVLLGVFIASVEWYTDQPDRMTARERAILDAQQRVIPEP